MDRLSSFVVILYFGAIVVHLFVVFMSLCGHFASLYCCVLYLCGCSCFEYLCGDFVCLFGH